ncbi:Biotin--protein ligase 1, chloroplastic [Dichanthelium oligosanthes]|uniref:Biotin--protein ligase 1, chloroplastic n=1 Tax=Dichanthelium oligosanthes TaxID=888268 RepID=A0A1E5WC10_9POAL|nr:Biotin--protein ligase 1, chloroplastic [Dichanthelium oligosanthes]
MRFPVRLSPPSTGAAAAAAAIGAVLAAVALRRYLSTSRHRPSASVTMSALRSSSSAAAAGAATTLVAYGRSPEDQEFLASTAGSVALGEGESAGEFAVALSYEGAGFDAGAYMGALRARRFGRWMLWSPRIGSTQDLISQNFAKLPVGVVCVADVQFKGRGRSKNVWESPPGCLMFSFTSQMQDVRKLPLMQYVVCLSVTEAIKELCRAKGLPELDVRIKWPNDLYLKGLKVGGILCTSSYEKKVYNICTVHDHMLTRMDSSFSDHNGFDGFQALEEQYYNSWLHSFDFFTGLVRRKMEA